MRTRPQSEPPAGAPAATKLHTNAATISESGSRLRPMKIERASGRRADGGQPRRARVQPAAENEQPHGGQYGAEQRKDPAGDDRRHAAESQQARDDRDEGKLGRFGLLEERREVAQLSSSLSSAVSRTKRWL